MAGCFLVAKSPLVENHFAELGLLIALHTCWRVWGRGIGIGDWSHCHLACLLLFNLRVSALRTWARNDQVGEDIFGFLLARLGQCTHSSRKHAWGTWTAPSPAGLVVSPSTAQRLYAVIPTPAVSYLWMVEFEVVLCIFFYGISVFKIVL